ncbi:MAG: glycosyltransferase [Micromonosporaceae bacterium]|nr:glycosyltransferase [Micromonosporaceae bacterium]
MIGRRRVATVITRLAGGAGGVALRGALAMDATAYDITLITGDAVEPHLLDSATAAGLNVVRLPALVARIDAPRDLAALHDLTALLVDGRYDVVHTHTAKAGAIGRLAALRAAVPRLVHTLHGFPFHDFQPAWRRGLYVTIERRLGQLTDVVLAVGNAVAAEAIRRRIAAPERIRTISPVVAMSEPPHGDAARTRARARMGIAPGIRIVGTVARVDYQKAPEHWVDALAEVAAEDTWGVWIGDGPMRERMLERVRQRGLTRWFRHLGHRADVAELLPAFDVFALASRYEGLPCAVVEAMGAGVPVVATAVNSVSDVVIPGVTGLVVPPAEPKLLGRAIRYLLDHPGDARRMAAAGRARLDDRFSASALSAVLDEAYRADVVAGASASPFGWPGLSQRGTERTRFSRVK